MLMVEYQYLWYFFIYQCCCMSNSSTFLMTVENLGNTEQYREHDFPREEGNSNDVITLHKAPVGQCDLDLGSSHYILSRHRSATHLDRSTPTSLTCLMQ